MRVLPALVALAVLMSGAWAAGAAVAQPPPAPFPDVPPWHWANQAVLADQRAGLVIGYPADPRTLVENSVRQVYDSFAHAHATGARAWAERFTYDRPGAWPQPLERSRLLAFSLDNVRASVSGDTATATFTARVATARPTGGEDHAETPMRVALRLTDGDWKIDYATLAKTAPVFR